MCRKEPGAGCEQVPGGQSSGGREGGGKRQALGLAKGEAGTSSMPLFMKCFLNGYKASVYL